MAIGATNVLGETHDMYMTLLMAQLQNQDPSEPMSNTEVVTQMSQLATLEGINELKMTFGDMLKLQSLACGADLVGRQVEYLANGEWVTDTVTSLLVRNGGVALSMAGGDVASLDRLHQVL